MSDCDHKNTYCLCAVEDIKNRALAQARAEMEAEKEKNRAQYNDRCRLQAIINGFCGGLEIDEPKNQEQAEAAVAEIHTRMIDYKHAAEDFQAKLAAAQIELAAANGHLDMERDHLKIAESQVKDLEAKLAAAEQRIEELAPGNGNKADDWCERHGYDGCPKCMAERDSAEAKLVAADNLIEVLKTTAHDRENVNQMLRLAMDITEGKKYAGAVSALSKVLTENRQNAERAELAESQAAELRRALEKMDCDCAAEWDREGADPGPCPRCKALSNLPASVQARAEREKAVDADLKAMRSIIEKIDCDCSAEWDREGTEPGPCPRCAALARLAALDSAQKGERR